MPLFKCECGYTTDQGANIKTHLKRKNSCVPGKDMSKIDVNDLCIERKREPKVNLSNLTEEEKHQRKLGLNRKDITKYRYG